MLADGGNAADAFVAATLAEYVVAEGGTSLAGTLGALVYDTRSGTVEYLDADYNHVADPRGRWRWRDGVAHVLGRDRSGKMCLVPGALRGLEELSRRHGRLGFARAIAPAIELASDGFPLSEFYASVLAWSAKVLKRSAYGRGTFFHRDGTPLRAGEVFRQPEVAAFLTQVQRHGADYMYEGDWASDCVAAVRAKGGRMEADDLSRWRPAWHEPWKISYRGHELYGPAGRQFGGVWVALALLALQHTNLGASDHFSRDADALELLLRTSREVWGELEWLEDPRRLDDRAFVATRLTSSYAEAIAQRVATRESRRSGGRAGSHSYHVIAADAGGSVVAGTNTIQSLPWGDGTFVSGIPLNQTGFLPSRAAPGARIVNALTMHLGFVDGEFRLAAGAFTGALLEMSLQVLVNLIDYRLPVEDAVILPRFGTFPHTLTGRLDRSANWLDRSIDPAIAATLRRRGLNVRQAGPLVGTGLDTGLGAALTRLPNGELASAVAPWPGLTAPWAQGTVAVKRPV